jgi:hypothetical protein
MRLLLSFLIVAQIAAAGFPMHALHAEKLGFLDCNLCHVPVAEGSVMLQRPGHDQCALCHDLTKVPEQKVCAQCHSSVPVTGKADLIAYPGRGKVLVEFAHAKHMDAKVRTDPRTGLRADCTFCHTALAKLPTHEACAACHAKPGYTPSMVTCRGCHAPEEMGIQLASSQYDNIKFSHPAHSQTNCTTCHYEVPRSASLATLSLPKMLDCVECHDTSRKITVEFRMSNCKTCHDDAKGGAVPKSHTLHVKPDFHTESFRVQHAKEASAPDAKCFVCHMNVMPSMEAKAQCVECHQVMRPVSHTAPWKEDTHGKYAALDRTTCAMCHNVEYCSSCHNELPRSHVPLPLFKAGAHATLAMLDQRSCLTCHTFRNTCASCHTSQLNVKPVLKK